MRFKDEKMFALVCDFSSNYRLVTTTRNTGHGLASLTEREKGVISECLRAASDGPFFPESEFHTLFGLQRAQVRDIAAAAPHIDDSQEDVALAINNALANLLSYPHHQREHGRGSFRSQKRKSVACSVSGVAIKSPN
jgi:hypothetical protein